MEEPMGFFIARTYKDPFFVLVSCLLSLRSRDTVTLPISQNLFSRVTSPQEMLDIPLQDLEEIIRPIGFFHQKARTLKHVSAELLNRFNGRVPSSEADLLSIKGIGRKTANLVLGLSFGIPAICVDTHVHRLSNQLGLVSTKTPEQTEEALKKILLKKDWIEFNNLLVTWGQKVPRSKQVPLLLTLLKNPETIKAPAS
jgi:endonuclease-3